MLLEPILIRIKCIDKGYIVNLHHSEKALRTHLLDTSMNRRATVRTKQVLTSPKKEVHVHYFPSG